MSQRRTPPAGRADVTDPATAALPTVDPAQARAALAEVVPRLVGLLRSVREPERPALGRWTVAEVAAHVTIAFEALPRLAARQIASPVPDFGVFPDMMVDMVDAEPERDLARLADRIEVAAARFLEGPAVTEPGGPRPWLFPGTQVSGTTFVCHLLNETLVHGYDIASATGRPWRIERTPAALAVGGFIVAVMRQLAGPGMVDQRRAAGINARFELRIRGGVRVVLALADGKLAVELPSARPVDCYVSADPVAFLLVLWDRRNQWGPIAAGRLAVWGRRPWLGLRLRGLINNP